MGVDQGQWLQRQLSVLRAHLDSQLTAIQRDMSFGMAKKHWNLPWTIKSQVFSEVQHNKNDHDYSKTSNEGHCQKMLINVFKYNWLQFLTSKLGCKPKKKIVKFCRNFLPFFCFLQKNVKNAYFNQHLECATPKHWSKYTTAHTHEVALVGVTWLHWVSSEFLLGFVHCTRNPWTKAWRKLQEW